MKSTTKEPSMTAGTIVSGVPAIQKANPMRLADTARIAADCDNWVVEQKFDGHRILVGTDANGQPFVTTGSQSGQGRDKTHLIPHVAAAARHLPPGTVLDGEADAADWGIVQRVLGRGTRGADSERVRFIAFDVLILGGMDVRGLPLRQRRQVLEAAIELCDAPITVAAQHDACDAQAVYERIVADGGEGVVLKHLDGTYRSGKRAKDWIKMKLVETADMVITGAVEGNGKFAGLIGALTFGSYDETRQMVERGQCSGMTDAERHGLTALWQDGGIEGLVIEVAYNGRVGDGLRHPQFKRIRTDKAPEECVGL